MQLTSSTLLGRRASRPTWLLSLVIVLALLIGVLSFFFLFIFSLLRRARRTFLVLGFLRRRSWQTFATEFHSSVAHSGQHYIAYDTLPTYACLSRSTTSISSSDSTAGCSVLALTTLGKCCQSCDDFRLMVMVTHVVSTIVAPPSSVTTVVLVVVLCVTTTSIRPSA